MLLTVLPPSLIPQNIFNSDEHMGDQNRFEFELILVSEAQWNPLDVTTFRSWKISHINEVVIY